jgi:hypothetical protein
MFIMCLDRKNNCHIIDYVFAGNVKTVCGLSLKKNEGRLNTIAADDMFSIPCKKCLHKGKASSNLGWGDPRDIRSSMARKNNDVIAKPTYRINLILKRWSKLIRLNISMNRKIHLHK